ncbi:EthD family reductase [Amycolatopsis xylanica]|nr:EthD family reductase [Amycolatopsis xylanica]
MHKMVVLYPAPLDPEHFREYYLNTHIPLATKMPGIVDWRYSFEVSAGRGESPYFAIFEADFPDKATFVAAVTSPEGVAAIADVPNYATGGSIALNYPVTTRPE